MITTKIIFGLPFFGWIGVLAFFFIVLQILIGIRIIKLPFYFHKKIIWVILLILVIAHAYMGLSLYLFSLPRF